MLFLKKYNFQEFCNIISYPNIAKVFVKLQMPKFVYFNLILIWHREDPSLKKLLLLLVHH